MICRGTYSPDYFLNHVVEYLRLGAGNWQVSWVEKTVEPFSKPTVLRLINPDKTPDEIETVERAICILAGWEYRE